MPEKYRQMGLHEQFSEFPEQDEYSPIPFVSIPDMTERGMRHYVSPHNDITDFIQSQMCEDDDVISRIVDNPKKFGV